MLKRALALSFALILFGCGENKKSDRVEPAEGQVKTVWKISGTEFKALDRGTLEETGETISGSGELVAINARTKPDNNYTLNFSLRNRGSVTLVANANQDLANGATLKFEALADGTVGVYLAAGVNSWDISAQYKRLNPNSINVSIDVHEHGHALIWVGSETKPEEYSLDTTVASRFWGVRLNNASISTAKAGEQKSQG